MFRRAATISVRRKRLNWAVKVEGRSVLWTICCSSEWSQRSPERSHSKPLSFNTLSSAQEGSGQSKDLSGSEQSTTSQTDERHEQLSQSGHVGPHGM